MEKVKSYNMALETLRKVDKLPRDCSEIVERQFYERILGIILHANFEKDDMIHLAVALKDIGCGSFSTMESTETKYCEGNDYSTKASVREFINNFLDILNKIQGREDAVESSYNTLQRYLSEGIIEQMLSSNTRILEYLKDDEARGNDRGNIDVDAVSRELNAEAIAEKMYNNVKSFPLYF